MLANVFRSFSFRYPVCNCSRHNTATRQELLIRTKPRQCLHGVITYTWQLANELYTSAFLEGVWSNELEAWVYTTREYLTERVQYAVLNLAEAAAKQQDFDRADELAFSQFVS